MSSKANKRHATDKKDSIRKAKVKNSFDNDSTKSSSCGSKHGSTKSNKNNKKRICVDNFFIVDRIIGHKTTGNKSFYKVRWQGYDENEDSWEPEENLSNVLDLIEDYLKSTEVESTTSSSGKRSKAVGSYVYVPKNELVASKTKYFDDIRDGKIDLTKHDLYSRVKTRKRLEGVEKEFDLLNEEILVNGEIKCMDDKTPENSNSTSSASDPSESKYYFVSNVDEISNDIFDLNTQRNEENVTEINKIIEYDDADEFIKLNPPFKTQIENIRIQGELKMEFNENIDQQNKQDEVVNQTMSTDDISLFNYSICTRTSATQSTTAPEEEDELSEDEDLLINVKTSPIPVYPLLKSQSTNTEICFKNSIGVQTNPVKVYDSNIPQKENGSTNVIVSKLEKQLELSQQNKTGWREPVTSDIQLFNVYARLVRQHKNSVLSIDENGDKSEELDLPPYESESIMSSIENMDELRTVIELNRYNVLKRTLIDENKEFNWNYAYIEDGYSPLQLCIVRRRVNMIQLMLTCQYPCRGDESGHRDPNINSPIVLAARLGHTACLTVLLQCIVNRAYFYNYDQQLSPAGSIMRMLDRALLAAVDAKRTTTVLILLQWGAGIRDDIPCTRRLQGVNTELSKAVQHFQSTFMNAVSHKVKQHLTKMNLRIISLLFPIRWVSILEPDITIEFKLDQSTCGLFNSNFTNSNTTPLLFLVHGFQEDEGNFYLWTRDGNCYVDSVTLNQSYKQKCISDQNFVTTLWPLQFSEFSSNKLYIKFKQNSFDITPPSQSLSPSSDLLLLPNKHTLPLIRVAIVPLIVGTINCTNTSTTKSLHHTIAPSRSL